MLRHIYGSEGNVWLVCLQIGKLAEGISKAAGKHKRDLLHLTFFALTSLSEGIKGMEASQELLRAAMPFLAVKVFAAEPAALHLCPTRTVYLCCLRGALISQNTFIMNLSAHRLLLLAGVSKRRLF